MTPRVLMVTGAYYPEISSGGVQCQTMARLLMPRVRVHVLTTAVDRTLPRHAIVEGVPVSRIMVDVTSAMSRILAARRMFLELLRLARRSDVVHVHGCSSKNVLVALVARLLGRRLVLSLHTAGYDEPDAIKRQGRLAWWAFRSADLCLSVSPALVHAYLAAGLPADRIQEVPNGIDTDRFSPASPGERAALGRSLGLAETRPVILFVGFFSRDKQPRVAFDAWLRVQTAGAIDATLVFVGATKSPYFEVEEHLAQDMQREAQQHGLADRLVFAGSTHEIQDYYRAAAVFVLPSRREGLPVALLEAMSCGLVCVASRLPGATDAIITDGVNGVLLPVGDTQAFASAITALLRDPERAAALGAAARETVIRRFTSADIADRWLAAYGLAQAESTN
jgi:glycosyltransferase involved in cell wall biosynthesis